jgi:hypothetical protein
MAKIRHRTFEMFDFLQEATSALASKSPRVTTDASDPESWKFRQLIAVSKPSGVVHITFQQRALSEADSVNDLGEDLADLTGLLVNGSRVLMDFEGVLEFDTDSIIKLTEFNSKLQTKGSRVVLCNLEPTVRVSFFPHRSTNGST